MAAFSSAVLAATDRFSDWNFSSFVMDACSAVMFCDVSADARTGTTLGISPF